MIPKCRLDNLTLLKIKAKSFKSSTVPLSKIFSMILAQSWLVSNQGFTWSILICKQRFQINFLWSINQSQFLQTNQLLQRLWLSKDSKMETEMCKNPGLFMKRSIIIYVTFVGNKVTWLLIKLCWYKYLGIRTNWAKRCTKYLFFDYIYWF